MRDLALALVHTNRYEKPRVLANRCRLRMKLTCLRDNVVLKSYSDSQVVYRYQVDQRMNAKKVNIREDTLTPEQQGFPCNLRIKQTQTSEFMRRLATHLYYACRNISSDMSRGFRFDVTDFDVALSLDGFSKLRNAEFHRILRIYVKVPPANFPRITMRVDNDLIGTFGLPKISGGARSDQIGDKHLSFIQLEPGDISRKCLLMYVEDMIAANRPWVDNYGTLFGYSERGFERKLVKGRVEISFRKVDDPLYMASRSIKNDIIKLTPPPTTKRKVLEKRATRTSRLGDVPSKRMRLHTKSSIARTAPVEPDPESETTDTDWESYEESASEPE